MLTSGFIEMSISIGNAELKVDIDESALVLFYFCCFVLAEIRVGKTVLQGEGCLPIL